MHSPLEKLNRDHTSIKKYSNIFINQIYALNIYVLITKQDKVMDSLTLVNFRKRLDYYNKIE